MMHGSTLVLRGVIILLGLGALAVCVFLLPPVIRAELAGDFDYLPILLAQYVTVVPFLFALYQAFRLLDYIDADTAFSELSVVALRKIKYCAAMIGAVYILGMPYIFIVAQSDDAPGLVALGLVIVGASTVVAVFAALLQKLLQRAIDIKHENDLTV